MRALVLFLLAVVYLGDARADPSCAAGQVGKWTVGALGTAYLAAAHPCSQGDVFSSAAAMRTACILEHGAASPNQGTGTHWAGNDRTTYDGVATSISVRSDVHSSTHTVSGATRVLFTALWSCTAPTCDEQANGLIDLPDPLNTPSGTVLCVNNCQVTVQNFLQITTKESTTGLIAYGSIGATPTACSTGNVTEPDRKRVCFQADGKQICAYIDDPNVVGDGFIDNPSPAPDYESAAESQKVENDECVRLASGGGFCTIGAAKTPDNGTPGVPAEPDAVVQMSSPFGKPGGSTTTYNYYSSSTWNNATNGANVDPVEGMPTPGEGGECDPETEECGEGGQGDLSGGGSCDEPPDCSDDPIGCYLAQQAWTQACIFKKPPAEDVTEAIDEGLGTSEMGGLIPKVGEFDVSTWFASAASAGSGCLSNFDITIPFPGGETFVITVPLEHACVIVQLLRFLILASAAWACLRIVMGGF